jgi:hypothetical protein
LNETHQAGGVGSAGGLGKKSAPTGETFIPECNEDGRFAEIQVSQARNRIKIESLRKQEKKCKNNLTLILYTIVPSRDGLLLVRHARRQTHSGIVHPTQQTQLQTSK